MFKTKNNEVSHKDFFYTDLNLVLDHVWELVASNGIPQAFPLSRKMRVERELQWKLSLQLLESSKPKQCF